MNPLYELLGVVPPGQPPDYYAFLGVARFEPDPTKVQAAACELHRLVKATELRFPIDSQHLLNLVGEATRCLKDPLRRAEHDARLGPELISKDPSSRSHAPSALAQVQGSRSADRSDLSAASWIIPATATDSFDLPAGAEWVIGSGRGCYLRVRDKRVSRRHCRIRRRDGVTLIEDLGSRNGTFVNDIPIDVPTPVEDADRITLGRQLVIPWPLPAHREGGDLRVLTIGRSKDCDLVLKDPSVSLMHAQLVTEGAVVTLYDLNSTNGTRLGGAGERIGSCEVLGHLPFFFGRAKVYGDRLLKLVEERIA